MGKVQLAIVWGGQPLNYYSVTREPLPLVDSELIVLCGTYVFVRFKVDNLVIKGSDQVVDSNRCTGFLWIEDSQKYYTLDFGIYSPETAFYSGLWFRVVGSAFSVTTITA